MQDLFLSHQGQEFAGAHRGKTVSAGLLIVVTTLPVKAGLVK